MEKVYVGKIVNTFGIDGELKVATNFECPEKIYQEKNTIIINSEPHQITSVRYHKEHYLITIDNLNDINLILQYKGCNIHVTRESLNLTEDEYLMDDLMNMQIIDSNKVIGNVTEVIHSSTNPLIKINNDFYLPIRAYYITKVDVQNKIIYTTNIRELML